MDWFFLSGGSKLAIGSCDCFRTQSIFLTERATRHLEWMARSGNKDGASPAGGSSGALLLRFGVARMQGWQRSAAVRSRKVSAPWKWAVLALQPGCKAGASCSWSTRTPGCAASGGNRPTRWSFAVSAVLRTARVGMGGCFVDLPVNRVFLHGSGAQRVKFGFQTPAWFRSYPSDQQMELREY